MLNLTRLEKYLIILVAILIVVMGVHFATIVWPTEEEEKEDPVSFVYTGTVEEIGTFSYGPDLPDISMIRFEDGNVISVVVDMDVYFSIGTTYILELTPITIPGFEVSYVEVVETFEGGNGGL